MGIGFEVQTKTVFNAKHDNFSFAITSNGRCAVDREFVHIERGRRRRRPGMGARWPEGGQEGAWQHPGIAAGGNWREPGEAGAGAGQGPGFTLNPSALVPTSARHIKHKASFFEHSSAKWTSWGLGKLFFRPSMSKA